MAKKLSQTKNTVPGSIYLRNKRYWWKVQLPGESACKARALKPIGSRFATTDRSVAIEVARTLWQEAIYHGSNTETKEIGNIASLVSAYLAYADGYYLDENGKPTREPLDISYALKPLTELFAALPAEDFGPLRLIEVRDRMIAKNWSRNLINQRVGKIKRMFKWGVCRQAISPVVYQGLMAVEGLKRGQSAAKELPKRKPVSEEHVFAVLPYTTPVISAMIQLQLLTGMRPGELVIIRPCDIDRSEEVWHYYPEKHKNLYRGKERIVSIGPKGQEIIRPYLLRPEDSYCFSPAESEAHRKRKKTEQRKTPLSCGNTVGKNIKINPRKKPGVKYDSCSYAKAVKSTIKAANKAIQIESKDAKLIPHWTPYQLRHTSATKVRREMGYESAGATLGHTNMSATAIYAERNQGLADEAAKKFG